MKKCFALILAALLMLCGCTSVEIEEPERIDLGGKTYITGFYGTLLPNEMTFENKMLVKDLVKYRLIRHETFEMYCAEDAYDYGARGIFCEESQYDAAMAFYADPENYSYFCKLGVDTRVASARVEEISQVDTAKFDALLSFADASDYIPFDASHNEAVETVELPMPDDRVTTRLTFYKLSKDSLFISSTADEYYIFDNHLYLVYQYDYGDGEYEKLIAVKVPQELSEYFVTFITPLL